MSEYQRVYQQGVDDWYDPEKTTEDLYPSPHENGLRTVAEAAAKEADRAAVRRVLDALESQTDDIVWHPEPREAIKDFIREMRGGLE